MDKGNKKTIIVLMVAIITATLLLSGCNNEEIKSESVLAETPFETIEELDESLSSGESYIKIEGESGFKRVTYEVILVSGKETSKKIINEKVIKKPVDEVVAIGPAE